MNLAATEFVCPECDHVAFGSRTALSKHLSSNHRRVTSIDFDGQTYLLAQTEDGTKYLCPKCDTPIALLNSLKRHMGQFCRAYGHERVHAEAGPSAAQAEDNAPQEEETVTSTLNLEEPRTLDDIGLTYETTWQVAICKLCHFVIDKAMPHLAVIWNDTVENELDESDDEGQGPALFTKPAFRPGSKALAHIPVLPGYKCPLCDQKLTHICVATKGQGQGQGCHFKQPGKDDRISLRPRIGIERDHANEKSSGMISFIHVW
ncbi:hypothetical protein V1506DRAFT_509649 [Lipomyces tetrasporus]